MYIVAFLKLVDAASPRSFTPTSAPPFERSAPSCVYRLGFLGTLFELRVEC